MTLVDGLTGDTECRGDLRPTPALRHGMRDGGVLEAIRLASERNDCSEGIAGILRQGKGLQLAIHRVNRS
jgi:hypothetical protein